MRGEAVESDTEKWKTTINTCSDAYLGAFHCRQLDSTSLTTNALHQTPSALEGFINPGRNSAHTVTLFSKTCFHATGLGTCLATMYQNLIAAEGS